MSDDEGFYSDEVAVADYLAHRHSGVSSPNRGMEEPGFEAAAGPLGGLDIVDLGCGDGTFARQCVDQGCSSYLGVDTSEPMLARASDAVPDPRASFAHGSIEEFKLPDAQVDLIAARMSLHYVADLAPVYRQAHAALRPGGRMIATVVHPVVTSQLEAADDGPRTSQVVDDYFLRGQREREWFGRPVVWHHRTIEDHIALGLGAGLQLDQLSECEPVPDRFDGDHDELARRRRTPLMLLLVWRSSADPGSYRGDQAGEHRVGSSRG